MAEYYITLEPMKIATITSATSEATGYPIEYAFDMNPDTYWKPTDGTADQDIIIDLGASPASAWGPVVWLQNYTTITNARDIEIAVSADNSSYTAIPQLSLALVDQTTPVRYMSYSGSLAVRYWRFRVKADAGGQVPQISMFGLFNIWTFTQGYQYPADKEYEFNGRSIDGPGGRRYTVNTNYNYQRRWTRTYSFPSATNWNQLFGAWNACDGKARPFFYATTTPANSTLTLCKFTSNINENQSNYLIYNPTVTFEEVPYIRSGRTY